MGLNILIVEDQFIEANELRNILQDAGHHVAGMAKSVDQALAILKKITPDIVLLDIFLKGPLTGIDLAAILGSENIPFIYISANSNASTLDAAKATHPNGFLIKPYRPKDIIVALDIASYRHQYALELKSKQSTKLYEMLKGILEDKSGPEQKLLSAVIALKGFLPFDYMIIDTNTADKSLSSFFTFERSGYNDFKRLNGLDFTELSGLNTSELAALRLQYAAQIRPVFRNGNDFLKAGPLYKISKIVRKLHESQSNLWYPLPSGEEKEMVVSFYSIEDENYKTEHLSLLHPVADLLTGILTEVQQLQHRIAKGLSPKSLLAMNKEDNPAFRHIIGKSAKLLTALDQVSMVAAFDASVLILGETGVGKEGLVKALHLLSSRRSKPLIRINCAAIPGNLVESELFGHERGAFTGAFERRIGKFEQAEGGTIFLDEIGEMPLEVQSKLLRVIQEKELERVGGRTTIRIDVRIVAATNRDLYKEVAAGRFRIDLYYRINVFPITLAPLRERKEDIPLLVAYFLKKHSASQSDEKQLSPAELQKLIKYSWPGNIRELENVIERHALLTTSAVIAHIDLPAELPYEEIPQESTGFPSIANLDRDHIIEALKKCNGKVSGKGGAAEMLQLPPTTLASKMKRLGIVWQYLLG